MASLSHYFVAPLTHLPELRFNIESSARDSPLYPLTFSFLSSLLYSLLYSLLSPLLSTLSSLLYSLLSSLLSPLLSSLLSPLLSLPSLPSFSPSAGVLSLLKESEDEIKVFALQRLNELVDDFWAEISESISQM